MHNYELNIDGGRQVENKFKKLVVDNSDTIIQLWLEEVNKLKESKYNKVISDDLFENTNKEFARITFASFHDEGNLEPFEDFAEKLINLGWPLSYITDGLQDFRHVALNFILEDLDDIEPQDFSNLLKSADDWVGPIIHQLVNEYSGSWEQIVSLQRVALQELSAPLIPVMDNITIMPLIGTIDTERARLIMENLLEGVINHNSEVVLIDITGVPVVDTMVAHHIIQAAEAVRLIGAKCILVGIRPEIAQTIVSLGIDLSEFPTRNSLRKGFTEALKITNRKISSLVNEGDAIEEMIESLHKE